MARPPLSRPPRPRRAGFALVIVLAFLVFVLAMITVIVKTLAHGAAALETQTIALQHEFLMRSAAERGLFRRSRDPEFVGEAWSPRLASGKTSPNITIEINDNIISIALENGKNSFPSVADRKTTYYHIEADHVVPW